VQQVLLQRAQPDLLPEGTDVAGDIRLLRQRVPVGLGVPQPLAHPFVRGAGVERLQKVHLFPTEAEQPGDRVVAEGVFVDEPAPPVAVDHQPQDPEAHHLGVAGIDAAGNGARCGVGRLD